jgi:general secretion pathway protein L
MPNCLGIDIGRRSVRVALSSGSNLRRAVVDYTGEVERTADEPLVETIRRAVAPLAGRTDAVVCGLFGDQIFVRRLPIPATAARQLGEVLPFELEADLPVDLSDLVYDSSILHRARGGESLDVLAVAARPADVTARIDLVKEAITHEPERVVPGGFAFASIVGVVPDLEAPGPIVVVDLEDDASEIIVLEEGEPVFARTLSRGTAGLPQTAPLLVRDLRQTIAAYRGLGGVAPERIFLTGAGATLPGAETFLGSELGTAAALLPPLAVAGPAPDALPPASRYVKAVALALAAMPRARGIDLRRGPLAYERGYGFLRDKIPILSGLAAVIVVSFFFSVWAEFFSLSREKTTLAAALSEVAQQVLGEETDDPQRATELLQKGPGGADEDPLPHIDAFDVMVELSKAVPEEVTHDIEELDVQRNHVVVHGIVPTIPDSQQIASNLKSVRCFQDVKIVRTNQMVGEERQKYVLEFDLKCPTESKEKSGAAPSGSAQPAGGAAGDNKP